MNALTLDLGNSALKLVRWNSETPGLTSVAWGDDWQGLVRAEFESLESGGQPQIGLASVVQPDREQIVVQFCSDLGCELFLNPEAPLDIECREPQTIGRDRLFAAAGAWQQDARAAIVVDAGTALTVDALGAGQERGCFLGGAIAPGPTLLARALGTGAAHLFEVSLEGPIPALGRDTLEALRSGVHVGFRGATAELVRRVSEEAGLEAAPVWLTGGASETLRGGALFGDREVLCDPLLVHRGLLASIAASR